jgi:hypothetical protein
MTMVETSDPRFARALAIADGAGQWLRIRDQNGHCKAVGIPSSRGDRFYIVTRESCDCEDWRRHQPNPCKHIAALEIAAARRRRPQLPASIIIDGLQAMLARRYEQIFREE